MLVTLTMVVFVMLEYHTVGNCDLKLCTVTPMSIAQAMNGKPVCSIYVQTMF